MNGVEFILNDNGFTFKELEQKKYKMACDEACNALREILESLDKNLLKERNTKVYRNKGRKQTCLRSLMGNIEYSRRIYEFNLDDGNKATKFLFDEYLGMDTVGNVSINLVETILTNVSEMSFRKTSENMKRSCNPLNSSNTLGKKIPKVLQIDSKLFSKCHFCLVYNFLAVFPFYLPIEKANLPPLLTTHLSQLNEYLYLR